MNATIDELLRPLSARSVVASALLGTHPPRLRGRLLVALAEEFGIGAGTTRVALSRMVERGELANHDGYYELSGQLARRQQRQDLGRGSAGQSAWDASWEQAIVVESGRAAGDRLRLRQVLEASRLGEVREGVWMRPANLETTASSASASLPPELAGHVLWFQVSGIDDDSAKSLATQIFDTDSWASVARELIDAMRMDAVDLAARFRLAAAVLQHLTRDPLLPKLLYPPAWPADGLRDAYRDYEMLLQVELRGFFAAAQ